MLKTFIYLTLANYIKQNEAEIQSYHNTSTFIYPLGCFSRGHKRPLSFSSVSLL